MDISPREQFATLIGTVTGGAVAKSGAQERNFWMALAIALFVHAVLLIGIGRGKPARLGEEKGAEQAISVSVVSEADLTSKTTAPVEVTPPSAAAAAPAPPAPTPSPPEPALEPKAQSEPVKPPQLKSTIEPSLEKETPDLFTLDTPGTKPKRQPAEAKPQQNQPQPKPQPKQVAKLDPPNAFDPSLPPSAGAGHSASFVRPPGITRSGANDDFARGVIRALQQTMPQLRGIYGRVTIRILLNENGNISDVQVIVPAKEATLNQDVAFAARQTNYPLPPGGSTVADRTFVITYIYD